MNNLDVEIYMNGVIKFFNENPKDLYNFVSEEKKSLFFDIVIFISNKQNI